MESIEGLVPEIGTSGKYNLVSPWKTDENVIYSCDRISSISDFKLNNNVDVLKTIYLDNGLTEADYEYAVKNNIKIITLKTDPDIVIDIPDNYIEKTPDIAYFPYQHKIVSLNLGLLPENLDLSNTLSELQAVVISTLNVKTDPLVHVYVSKRFVNWQEYTELETSRKSGIVTKETLWERMKELEQENRALSIALVEYEKMLLDQ